MSFDHLPPFTLLVGSHLTGVVFRDYDWLFELSGGVSVVVESNLWRLVSDAAVLLTSRDHDQLFGLKEPVDAGVALRTDIGGSLIRDARISPVGDLILSFENGHAIEILIGSFAYENWHIYGPNGDHFFAMGGGDQGYVEGNQSGR